MSPNDESLSELTLEYYINLGRQYYQGQNWEGAINNYLKALELQPDYFRTYYALGYSYFQDGQWDSCDRKLPKSNGIKTGFN